MKPRIAVVMGFSEACEELVKQCIVSCWVAAKTSSLNAEYHFFPYECNYEPPECYSQPHNLVRPFKTNSNLQKDLSRLSCEIHQIDSSGFAWKSILPDIAIYHHFTTTYMHSFDYTLFCHNDVFFKKYMLFDDVVTILNTDVYNLVAAISVNLLQNISLRFRPHFIFAKTNKFRESNLSFCNDYMLFNTEDIRERPIETDGGGPLLASYYSKNNSMKYIPFTEFPNAWLKHFRVDTDHGIEIYNIYYPDTSDFKDIINNACKYVDYHLYGDGYEI